MAGRTRLKRFVNACHGRGLAVVLDVVYNHFGPTGNYAGRFGAVCDQPASQRPGAMR